MEPNRAEQCAVVSAICASRATTVIGLQERAKALLTIASDLTDHLDDEGDYQGKRLAGALVRDLLAMGGVA
jgi:hypothetical protein